MLFRIALNAHPLYSIQNFLPFNLLIYIGLLGCFFLFVLLVESIGTINNKLSALRCYLLLHRPPDSEWAIGILFYVPCGIFDVRVRRRMRCERRQGRRMRRTIMGKLQTNEKMSIVQLILFVGSLHSSDVTQCNPTILSWQVGSSATFFVVIIFHLFSL